MKIQLGRASAGHTLLRYFLSYFLVAGILLLSFVLIAYNLLASAVSDRIYAQTEQRLEYVADRLEAELQSAFELNAALTGNIDVVLSRYDDSAMASLWRAGGSTTLPGSIPLSILPWFTTRRMAV